MRLEPQKTEASACVRLRADESLLSHSQTSTHLDSESRPTLGMEADVEADAGSEVWQLSPFERALKSKQETQGGRQIGSLVWLEAWFD